MHYRNCENALDLLGDPNAIPRLLSILLENASKYTPPGGAVTLSAAVDAERVVLSVRDTGVGIAPQHLPRIFDRFYRVAQVRTDLAAGSGLGLALGKWIAERHGAELRVESKPGCGTCFSFELQLRSPQGHGGSIPTPATGPSHRSRSTARPA
jgi:two-component system, OmpR family, sensor histidine kinase CiaH